MRHPRVDERNLSVPRLALVAAMSAALSYQTPAIAQARDASLVLEEIIVSAQKELENVQDIPATVNAISSANIDDFKILSIDDIGALAPGVSFERPDARRQTITVRGVTSDPDNVAQAPVTIYINDQPVRAQEGFQSLFDVSLIEILRGPQGTLQGRTDPAGAIHVYTQRPNTSAVDGYVQQTFQDNDGSNTQFGVSLPIIEDVLAVRLAGVYDDNEGQEIQNIFTGQQEQQRTKSGRVTVSWLPTDSIETTLTYAYSEFNAGIPQVVEGDIGNLLLTTGGAGLNSQEILTAVQNDPLGALLGFPTGIDPADFLTIGTFPVTGEQIGGAYFASNPYIPIDKAGVSLEGSDRKAIHGGISDTLFRNDLATFNMDIDMDTFTISWITGYKESLSDNILDRDDAGAYNAPQLQQTVTKLHAYSQEIRFAFTEDEFWEYQFGLFYENQVTSTQNNVDSSSAFAQLGAIPNIQPWDFVSGLDIPVERETFGVFLHNKFNLSDSTTMQVGVRWQQAKVFSKATPNSQNNYDFARDTTGGADFFDPFGFTADYSGLNLGGGAGNCPVGGGVFIPCNNVAIGALQGLNDSGAFNVPFAVSALFGALPQTELIPENLQNSKENAVTGGIKLQHYLDSTDHETMVYVALDRSYRPQGVTITPSLLPADVLLFDEETSDSLEFGFKSTLQDGSLRVNGSVFIQQYDGYQARADVLNFIDPSTSSVAEVQGGVTFNADVTITGVELEFQKALASTWTVNGGLAYIDATFDSGEEGPCNGPIIGTAVIATCDIGGQQVSAQPLWSGTINSEYYIPMEGTEVYFRGLASYRGQQTNRLVEGETIPDHVLLNLYAGIRDTDRVWDFSVWAKNASDVDRRADLKNVYETGLGSTNFRRSTMIAPRLLGMTLRYNFGT